MSYARNATLALTAAAPGWTVAIGSDDNQEVCPVVAWASVVIGFDRNDDPKTETQPVFVGDGQVMTEAEYRAAYDPHATFELRHP